MSVLNAPLALSTPPITYDAWRHELDRICKHRLSLGLDDLPNLPTHDAYRDGVGPAVFFELIVLPRLDADDVSALDMIACDSPDHENLLDELIHGDH